MPRTIVFGGAGFLGSHVVDALRARGHQVVVFDRRPLPHDQPEVQQVIGDICDAAAVAAAAQGCDHAPGWRI